MSQNGQQGGVLRPGRHLDGGLAFGDPVERRHRRLGVEGTMAGQELAEQGADAEEIAPAVHALPAHLFRGHVAHGPQHGPARRPRGGEERDPEIHDPGRAFVGEKDVRRLDVAVDDPGLVRMAQAVENLGDDRELLLEWERGPPAYPREEVLAPEKLHHDVWGAVGVVAEVEDGHHAGVTQSRDRPGFALEPLLLLRVPRRLGEHDLEGHLALEDGVEGLIDRPHAPAPEQPDDLVLADARASGCFRRGLPFALPSGRLALVGEGSPSSCDADGLVHVAAHLGACIVAPLRPPESATLVPERVIRVLLLSPSLYIAMVAGRCSPAGRAVSGHRPGTISLSEGSPAAHVGPLRAGPWAQAGSPLAITFSISSAKRSTSSVVV